MLNSEDYLNIFHEIKNSITLISSSLQLVEKKHPEVSDFAYWAETMSEITSLRNMVTELSSARLCDHLNLRHVNLYDYMEDIHDSISAFAALDFHCNIITEENLPEGLDPAFADSIFEPFITSKNGGSGLGLVITKQIVESHHGTIHCDSRSGDGCTFTLTLPLTQS